MPVVGVCEDEPALRSVLTRALRAMGHDPLVVATAAEALRAFARQRPAVMILDIGLPDADGRDLCLALRASGVEAPVLFLTARDGLHDKIAGFEAGGDDYLTKPFDLDEVRVRLDALLRRTPAPAAADPGGAVLDPARHALVLDETEVSLTPTEFRLAARRYGQRQHARLLRPSDPQEAGGAGPGRDQHRPRGRLPVAVRPPSLRARMAATALLVSTLTAAVLVVGLQVILGRSNDATAVSRARRRPGRCPDTCAG